MKGLLAFPITFIILIGTPAFADYAAGLIAYNGGDYATALKEFKPLAKRGKPRTSPANAWQRTTGAADTSQWP